MALDPDGLEADLASLAASGFGDTASAAQAWADAVESYAAAIIPASTTVSTAAATLKGALQTAFDSGAAAGGMETAFASFASTVGTGMAPSFTATPPPGEVGFASQFAGTHPETHAAAGAQVASLIDAWMKTGTATPSAGGSPVNWS